MFLRNNAKVYLLNIKSFENNPDFPYLPKDSFSTSFSNLKIFQFSVDSQPLYNLPNTYSFLKSLSQSCNTLSHIFIDSYFNNNDDGKEEIFFNIIKSQRNIKKFIINSHDGYLAEDDESSFLKILKEETNVKIVDQDEIKFESSPLYFDYLYKR
ncbi:10170_t:CDS:2 [Rhizophagus irregularis]|nr:10170_t:CDS:2 [Rhizophagus irregularis]